MKKLLEIAASHGCKAEVFSTRKKSVEMSTINGAVNDVSASIQFGVSLRILKDGKQGFAYAKNLTDREELVQNALASLKAGVEINFDFPASGSVSFTEDYDESVEKMGFAEAKETIDKLKAMYSDVNEGVVSLAGGSGTSEIRILNTSGSDLYHKDSSVFGVGSLMYPGTSSGLNSVFAGKSAVNICEKDALRTIDYFKSSIPEVEVGDSRMKVLFAPDSMYALTWRLSAASSAKAFYEKVSPLLDKKNQQVFSPLLSFVNDPTSGNLGRRVFDDEGIKTGEHAIFKNGVFTTPYYNLDYASKMNEKPFGTGFRGGMWGGDKISVTPSPSLAHARFAYGEKSFEEMLSMIDRGVIVYGSLGAHSGNILNGDLSIGLNPGLYVENGKVVGRVKDAMMAGNIYSILSNVIAVENSAHYTDSMYDNPSILIDDVSVVGS